MTRSLCPVAALLLSAPALADVLTVGPPGSGFDFESFEDAVAAAAPGDQLRLAAGSYFPAVIDKSLQVLGESRESVTFLSPSPFADGLTVVGLGPDDSVHLSGFTIAPASSFASSAQLAVISCAGPVTLDDLQLGSNSGPSTSGSGLAVSNSALVLVSDSVLESGDIETSGVLANITPSPAVRVDGSLLIVEGCSVSGGDAGEEGFAFDYKGTWGGAGIEGELATLVVSDSAVTGGLGSAGQTATITGHGGSALDLITGRVEVSGDSVLTGGDAKLGDEFTLTGIGGSGVRAEGIASITVTPDVVIDPGLGGTPLIEALPFQIGDEVIVELPAERRLTLHAENLSAEIQIRVELEVRAEPGTVVFPYVALSAAAPVQLPGFDGIVVIDPFAAIDLTPVALGADSTATVSVLAPNDPLFTGLPAVFTGFRIDATSGTAEIGVPSVTTLRP